MLKTIDPQMHSAEHILNQAMVRLLKTDRCFSAHINPKKSKCDYVFDRSLSMAEAKEIENEVNRVIQEDCPVVIEQMPMAAAQKEFNLTRVPDKDGLSEFRVVRMGDYDACPCIGSHVSSTGEIGNFVIISTGYENKVLRIRFKLI